jgi:hypothetical protein
MDCRMLCPVDSAVNARVRAQFEAMMLQPMFSRIESAFGSYGAIVTQSFEGVLAQMLEQRHE